MRGLITRWIFTWFVSKYFKYLQLHFVCVMRRFDELCISGLFRCCWRIQVHKFLVLVSKSSIGGLRRFWKCIWMKIWWSQFGSISYLFHILNFNSKWPLSCLYHQPNNAYLQQVLAGQWWYRDTENPILYPVIHLATPRLVCICMYPLLIPRPLCTEAAEKDATLIKWKPQTVHLNRHVILHRTILPTRY